MHSQISALRKLCQTPSQPNLTQRSARGLAMANVTGSERIVENNRVILTIALEPMVTAIVLVPGPSHPLPNPGHV